MADPELRLDPQARTAGLDSQRRKTFSDSYRVLYTVEDASSIHQGTVLDDFIRISGIGIGSPFPPDWVQTFEKPFPDAWCRDIKVSVPEEDDREFKVDVDYGWEELSSEESEEAIFLDPPQISFDTQVVQIPLDFDIEGRPVVNTSGDPFDPTISGEENQAILSFEVNRPISYWRLVYTHNNTVNADEWLGIPARCAKVSLRSVVAFEPAIGYYLKMSFQFAVNRNTWDQTIPSLGRRQLVDGERKAILDSSGVAVTDPVKLSETGTVLDAEDDPVLLTFKVLEESNFSDFGLDALILGVLGG